MESKNIYLSSIDKQQHLYLDYNIIHIFTRLNMSVGKKWGDFSPHF